MPALCLCYCNGIHLDYGPRTPTPSRSPTCQDSTAEIWNSYIANCCGSIANSTGPCGIPLLTTEGDANCANADDEFDEQIVVKLIVLPKQGAMDEGKVPSEALPRRGDTSGRSRGFGAEVRVVRRGETCPVTLLDWLGTPWPNVGVTNGTADNLSRTGGDMLPKFLRIGSAVEERGH